MNIEAMAREAGMTQDAEWWFSTEDGADCDVSTEALTRFAALVRAQALEDAALVCEERMTYWQRDDARVYEDETCAAALRALKEQVK